LDVISRKRPRSGGQTAPPSDYRYPFMGEK